MSSASSFDWDAVYDAGENWADVEPSDYVLAATKQLPMQASILDAGCGNGRNAICLAQLGHDVEAFDISATAVKQLQVISTRLELSKLTAYQANLLYWQSKQRYDFIVVHGVLNSVPADLLLRVTNYLRNRLNPGGLCFASIFHPLPNEVSLGGVNVLGDIDSSFLTEQGFFGCAVERHDIRIFTHSHRSLPEHTHCIERFLFRRPLLRERPLADA